jgi:tetratricopeptide (TPR) repeat protein
MSQHTFTPKTQLPFIYRHLRMAAIFAACTFVSLYTWADDYADVAKLIRGNQMVQALGKADQFLAAKPKDPQMRFLKGVIQSETNKINDAINTFTKLSEEFPELPEPHNNLAVLYANGGQFEKARTSLEMAIRTNPSYGTAHENLGDLYARMASQAYSKALQLDGTNTALSPKLALIKDLFTPGQARGLAPRPASPSVAASTQAAAPAQAAAASTAPPTPTTAPAAVDNKSVLPANPVATLSSNISSASAPASNKDITLAVESWAKAWSDRNMNAYLGSYAKEFVPPSKMNRAEWEDERKARIMGKAKINVKLSDLQIKISGTTATAIFRQDYKADALATNSRKTLELKKYGERWLIIKEVTG